MEDLIEQAAPTATTERPAAMAEVRVHRVSKSLGYPFGAVEFHLDGFDAFLNNVMTRMLKSSTKKFRFTPPINGFKVMECQSV